MSRYRDTEEGLDLWREDLEGQPRREAWDEHVWQEPSEDLTQLQQTERYLSVMEETESRVGFVRVYCRLRFEKIF